MSAPKQAYKSKSIVINGIRHNCTKLQVSEATHKSRFYLDGYVSSGEGIVGFVEIGGENANMHNLTKRGGAGRAMHGGKMVRMLNDGGLNTLGITNSVLNKLRYSNRFRFESKHLSAYYIDTISHGVRFRKQGSTSWITLNDGYIAKANLSDVLQEYVTAFQQGDIIEYQGFIENNEGTYYTSIYTVEADYAIMQLNANVRSQPCEETNNNIIVYTTEDEISNIPLIPENTPSPSQPNVYLYEDIEKENPVPSGWYAGLYPQRTYNVDNNGRIAYYRHCEPQPSYVYVTLSAMVDFNTNIIDKVSISIAEPYTQDIRVAGIILDNDDHAPGHGKNFDLTIPTGQTYAEILNFNLPKLSPRYYYWVQTKEPATEVVQVVHNAFI